MDRRRGNGNEVEGNQIGMVGPSSAVSIMRSATEHRACWSTARATSSAAPVAPRGNVISGNGSDGIDVIGPVATRTVVGANFIGLAPGGGYLLGSGDPGNVGDGILIDNSTSNIIGGPSSTWGNTISSNSGDGVMITGTSSTGNTLSITSSA